MAAREEVAADDSYFTDLLRQVGLTLYRKWPHSFDSRDPNALAKRLRKAFAADLDHPRLVEAFIKDARAFFDQDEANLVASLQPMQTSVDGKE